MKHLLTVFSIAWLSIIAVGQDEIHRNFPFEAKGEIEIMNARGEIHVTGWDEAKVQIDAFKKGDRTLFEQVQLVTTEEAKYLKIGVKYPATNWNTRTGVTLELHVKVPRGAALKAINSSSGSISITNLDGVVLAQSISGDIICNDLKNNCALSSNSGQIVAAKIEGLMDARTLSGDIRLESIGGNVRANSTSGDIALRGLRSKAFAATTSGDLNIEQVSGTVTASATSGDLIIKDIGGDLNINNVSGDITVANVTGRATVSGINTTTIMHSIGAGVRITSVSGDVELAEIKGLTEVRSTNGDITLKLIDSSEVQINSHSGTIIFDGEFKENGRYNFESFNGDITVYVAASSNFSVSAKTFNGEISNDFDFKPTGTRPTKLQGSHGNESGANITIVSFSSDVNLRKKKK
jgi:hypothetical protein